MSLSDLDVLVIDCQSTGAAPDKGVIFELGWAKTAGKAERAASEVLHDAEVYWLTLPVDHHVPLMVRRLSGMDAEDRSGAISEQVAVQRLETAIAQLGGGPTPVPTVIHFARFELSFLRDLFQRCGVAHSAPPLETVCLHELARRLLPDLPRRSLRALAGYSGHTLPPARRVHPHLQATAFVYRDFIARLAERGITSWEDLQSFVTDSPAPKSRRINPLPRSAARDLPDGPGVYRFCRSNGDVLYVGKATSLRDRVATHLTRSKHTNERALEMLSQARQIDITSTRTTLEAALLECDEIKRLDPPYNMQLRTAPTARGVVTPSAGAERGVWFASRTFNNVSSTPSAQQPYGPFPSRFSIVALGALIQKLEASTDPELPGLCLGVPPRFAPEPAFFDQVFHTFAEEVLRPRRRRTARGTVLRAGHGLLMRGFNPRRVKMTNGRAGTHPEFGETWSAPSFAVSSLCVVRDV